MHLGVRGPVVLRDDTPTVAQACAHLGEVLGEAPPDCEALIGGDVEGYGGETGQRLLRCLGDALNAEELGECSDPSYVYGYQRARREKERAERATP